MALLFFLTLNIPVTPDKNFYFDKNMKTEKKRCIFFCFGKEKRLKSFWSVWDAAEEEVLKIEQFLRWQLLKFN